MSFIQGTRRTLEISNHPDTQPVYIEDPSTKGPKVVARVIPEGSAQTSVVPFAVNKDPLQHSVPSTSHASHALVRLTEDTPDYNFPHNPTSKVPVIPQVPMIPRVPMIQQVPMIQPVPMIQQGLSLHPVSDRPELPSQTLIAANHSVVDMPLFHQGKFLSQITEWYDLIQSQFLVSMDIYKRVRLSVRHAFS